MMQKTKDVLDLRTLAPSDRKQAVLDRIAGLTQDQQPVMDGENLFIVPTRDKGSILIQDERGEGGGMLVQVTDTLGVKTAEAAFGDLLGLGDSVPGAWSDEGMVDVFTSPDTPVNALDTGSSLEGVDADYFARFMEALDA